jgi:hypothetical protein
MKSILGYSTAIVIALTTGIYFYIINPENFKGPFLIIFSLFPFLLFATGLHGLIAHLTPASVKEKAGPIFYPVLMGVIFVILFLIHIFIVLPLACPDFLKGGK